MVQQIDVHHPIPLDSTTSYPELSQAHPPTQAALSLLPLLQQVLEQHPPSATSVLLLPSCMHPLFPHGPWPHLDAMEAAREGRLKNTNKTNDCIAPPFLSIL
jgi:hypothetical protein